MAGSTQSRSHTDENSRCDARHSSLERPVQEREEGHKPVLLDDVDESDLQAVHSAGVVHEPELESARMLGVVHEAPLETLEVALHDVRRSELDAFEIRVKRERLTGVSPASAGRASAIIVALRTIVRKSFIGLTLLA